MSQCLKYIAVMNTSMQSRLLYLRDIFLRLAFTAITIIILVKFWSTTYNFNNNDLQEGFTLNDMVWYMVLTQTVMMGSPRGIASTLDEEVRSGGLIYVLTKPYNFILYYFSTYWGEGILQLPISFIMGGIVAVTAVGWPNFSFPDFLAVIMSIILGVTINFVIETLIGLTAIWFENTQPFVWIYQKLLFTLGGLFLPLELFPKFLQDVSKWLPFAAVTYAPARLFVHFSWEIFLALIMFQISWLLGLGLIMKLVYSVAIKRMRSNGG